MSIRKRFNEIFGLEDNVEAERKRFVQRVNQTIFHFIDTVKPINFQYPTLFRFVCFELGVNANDFPQGISCPIIMLTGDDFNNTLLVLCILYVYLEGFPGSEKSQKWLSDQIESVLSRCSYNIGIRWKEGFFYPAGAEDLDKPLIEETLTWLKDYPDERKDYQKALECSLKGDSLTDVIDNCYLAMEGVTRKILGNDKTLDNNKEQLLRKIDLSGGWKSILANYITYAHDFRHASGQRHEIKEQEAEGYLYMTGLIIRLIIESK